ncbi:MAG: histidine kinase dimerization/phospho-acceptor domain-containing protein [Velocimicrobium sp.]
MAIKLKNITREWYIKVIAYLILAACVIGTFLLLHNKNIGETVNLSYDYAVDRYEESYDFRDSIADYVWEVYEKEAYESTEAIRKGSYDQEIRDILSEPYQEWVESNGLIHITMYEDYNKQINFSYDYDNKTRESYNDEEIDLSYSAFLKEYPDLEELVKKSYVDGRIRNFEEDMEQLESETRFVYQSGTKEEEERLIETFKAYPIYGYIKESGAVTSNSAKLEHLLDGYNVSGKTLFVGVKKSYYEKKMREWNQKKEDLKDMVQMGLVLVLIGLVAFVFLMAVTGRKPKEEMVHLYWIDTIISEIVWAIGILCITVLYMLLKEIFVWSIDEDWYFQLWLFGVLVAGTFLLECILMQIRKVKAGKFLDGFLCFRLVKRIIKVILACWNKGKLSKRAIILAVFLPMLCVTLVGAPFVIVFLIYVIYKYIGDFTEITEGTQKIRGGQLDYKIQVKSETGILGQLAENINSLSQGLDAAVSKELRSERLKAELISNVSHDLKTPLTSIVTYVDLLKQENIENETQKNYIDIIDRKTQRLTILTTDLFEAAKASSGDMPVNLEKVDLNALIRQSLGEFDEKIQMENLEIRTNLPEGGAYICADGKLTWRVLENLLSNVMKYGQSGSRVYMEVKEEGREVCFVIKNMSAYELNIPVDELLDRFRRGDESRNSDGSGLGLSIANSLVTLQHGSFQIEVDGDLFKVTIRFPSYRK